MMSPAANPSHLFAKADAEYAGGMTTTIEAVQPMETDMEGRKGSRCCGCCCDYRRAVIIVNIIIAVLELLVIVVVATGMYPNMMTGDGTGSVVHQQEWEDFLEKYEIFKLVFSVISITLCFVAVFGAIKFNVWMVTPSAVWLLLGWMAGLVSEANLCQQMTTAQYGYTTCELLPFWYMISFVAASLFIYPHVGFIWQVKKGILSKETYPRENSCCCCT